MTDQRSGSLKPQQGEPSAALGWLKDFFRQFQLAWRLVLDPRVPAITKIIPFVTVAYLIWPFDPLPDLALGLGQLDDLAVLFIGLRMFIDLCPIDLVEEHMAVLTGVKVSVWKPTDAEVVEVQPALPQTAATEMKIQNSPELQEEEAA